MSTCMFLCRHIFTSLGCTPQHRLTESYTSPMFNFLSKCQAVFQRNCTMWQPHQQRTVCQLLHILTNTNFLSFYYKPPQWVGRSGSFSGLICVLLTGGDVEHLLVCLLAMCTPSLKKWRRPLPVFKFCYLSFYCWVILNPSLLSSMQFANFSHSVVVFSFPWCVLWSTNIFFFSFLGHLHGVLKSPAKYWTRPELRTTPQLPQRK